MEEVGLSDKKMGQLNKMPIIETKINVSNDGKWIVHRTVIIDIKPRKFWDKVLEEAPKEE